MPTELPYVAQGVPVTCVGVGHITQTPWHHAIIGVNQVFTLPFYPGGRMNFPPWRRELFIHIDV